MVVWDWSWKQGVTAMSTKNLFLGNRRFLKVDCGDICTILLIKTIELYSETNSIYGTHMLTQ